MKRGRQILCGVLAAVLMIPLAAAAPGSGSKSLSDIQGHWAQKEIETAIASGWVDGYPDGTFKPEKTITRAEFTKMLLDAIHLTPDSETVAWMVEAAKQREGNYGTTSYKGKLNDMSTHWLTTQGWTQAALYSGMVVPSDYNGGNFRPEKEIARYEIALMTDRALGLVSPANAYAGEALPFADNADILDWMKGYVNEAVKAGVLQGYPDNTFRPNKTSTRAEAVVMVQRMLDEMEQGLDPEGITVVAWYQEWVEQTFQDPLLLEERRTTDQIRLQVVDDVIYANLRDIYALRQQMMENQGSPHAGGNYLEWWPVEQRVDSYITNISNYFAFEYPMGEKEFVWENESHSTPAPLRALYGEVMVPVCDLNHPSSEPGEAWQAGWDGNTKTLTLYLPFDRPIFVGS